MKEVSRAALGRIPAYLKYLRALPPGVENISATTIAKELHLGEVQVRKDLGALCGAGKPKVGYLKGELTESLEGFFCCRRAGAVIVGAGRLGRALLDHEGFPSYGLTMLAAFDKRIDRAEKSGGGKPILPMKEFSGFCKEQKVEVGVIAVPAESAQAACDQICRSGIKLIWSFSPYPFTVPVGVTVQYENLALSLAYLTMRTRQSEREQGGK